MSDQKTEIKTAAAELTHAVSGMVRALDAVGDERASAKDIPDELRDQLGRLVDRLNAASGFSD